MKTVRVLSLTAVALFALSTSAMSQTFQVLHSFKGGQGDGSYPSNPPLLSPNGGIVGATLAGGADITGCGSNGCGTVFELTKGYGHWKDSLLYSFSSTTGSFFDPVGPLTMDAAGNIYGTQAVGGDASCSCGTVYELVFSGGVWTENVLHEFGGGLTDGAQPESGLVQDSAGNLYGTTVSGGGSGNGGTVFELAPNSSGGWNYSLIYQFNTTTYDGTTPSGPLMIDSVGNVYGTTIAGGNYGWGTVFRLSPNDGTWTETILFNFPLDYGSGPNPTGVVADAAGNLYGTTANGGAYAVGTIYKLTPSVGLWNRTVLHTFSGGADGAYPASHLVIDSSGTLYGTCNGGGTFGYGNVYKMASVNDKWRETPLHQFKKTDGASPYPGVVLDTLGDIYGVTNIGGLYGYGVVFEIMP
jgi:uncharacterized repeat protein (TIGR03803 family)